MKIYPFHFEHSGCNDLPKRMAILCVQKNKSKLKNVYFSLSKICSFSKIHEKNLPFKTLSLIVRNLRALS
jgi:hypothetical protein